MQRTIRNRPFAVATAAAALLCGLALSPAQPAPEARERRPEGRQFEAQGPDGGMPLERILNEDQRRSLRELTQDQRERMRDLTEQSRAARRALMDAALAEKPDKAEIKEAAARLGKVEAETAMRRAELLARLQPPLSPEQKERLRGAVERMGDRVREAVQRWREGAQPGRLGQAIQPRRQGTGPGQARFREGQGPDQFAPQPGERPYRSDTGRPVRPRGQGEPGRPQAERSPAESLPPERPEPVEPPAPQR